MHAERLRYETCIACVLFAKRFGTTRARDIAEPSGWPARGLCEPMAGVLAIVFLTCHPVLSGAVLLLKWAANRAFWLLEFLIVALAEGFGLHDRDGVGRVESAHQVACGETYRFGRLDSIVPR